MFLHKKEEGKPAPKTLAAPTGPAKYVVLDIETGFAPQKEVEAAVNRWKAPGNVKDEKKIEARREEYAKKTEEKSALLDGAPIICIGARTDTIGAIFNGMTKKEYKIKDTEVMSGGKEAEMLKDFREWLDQLTGPETVLVGFNLIAFDLPKLRSAYVRNRLKLPAILNPRPLEDLQPVVDIMRLFTKFFSPERHDTRMVSLDEVIDRLGLPQYKDRVNGGRVPKLHRQKKYKEILTYCMIDVLATWAGYLLLTSQAQEMS